MHKMDTRAHSKRNKKHIVLSVICVLSVQFANVSAGELKIISSSDPGSAEVNSFIYLRDNVSVVQGVKKDNKLPPLKLQIPFVVDLPEPLKKGEVVQWFVTIESEDTGGINILSKFKFNKARYKKGFQWVSEILKSNVEDNSRLVFRPQPLKHQPPIYKKGRGGNGKRQRYGGGTQEIDERLFNPRLFYRIEAKVLTESGQFQSYHGKIEMDNKDMVRQEYINHFGINRYGRGDYGHLPVPLRDELSPIPKMPAHLLGVGLSESRYGLMIDDGLTELAVNIVHIFEEAKRKYKSQSKAFLDLNNQPLIISESELWLSGGWRNPERNEWYSNALNGIHQRGGAIDIVANEPHSDKRSAIVYWFLWTALEEATINAFWQLETHGRPMTTREFKEDIEPKNGIPDAFDKADHIHINIKYE